MIFVNSFKKISMTQNQEYEKRIFETICKLRFIMRLDVDTYKFTHVKIRDFFAIHPLLNILTSETNIGKGFVAYALAQIGRMVKEPLIFLLDSDNPDVIERVLWALGELRDNTTIPAIRKFLLHEDEFVRGYAIEALGNMECDSVVDLLINIYEEGEPSSFAKQALVTAFGKLGDGKAKYILQETLDDPNLSVRNAAVNALEQLSTDDDLEDEDNELTIYVNGD